MSEEDEEYFGCVVETKTLAAHLLREQSPNHDRFIEDLFRDVLNLRGIETTAVQDEDAFTFRWKLDAPIPVYLGSFLARLSS